MCGGGGYSPPPPPPWAQRVRWIDSDYTKFEGGDWFKDPNRHFEWEGENYYITPEDDIEDQSTWKKDTASQHISAAYYENMMARQREMEAAAAYNQSLLAQMVERNRIMAEAVAAQKERWAAQQAAMAEARRADEERRKRRLRLAALGNGTLLHGGRGVTAQATVYRPTLGAA